MTWHADRARRSAGVGESFVDTLLQRWPIAAEKAELVDGVLPFTSTFDELDVVTARRTYPGGGCC